MRQLPLRVTASIVALALCLTVTSCAGSSESGISATTGVPTTVPGVASTVAVPAPTIAPTPSAQSACSTLGSLPTGATDDLHIESDGADRVYRRFVPSSYDPSEPAPLVVSFHGITSPIIGQVVVSDFETKAEAVGAIVLTPLGSGRGPSWNVANFQDVGEDIPGEDEAAFVNDLIRFTESEACIDTQQVFAIGMSNGAEMASLAGCELSSQIAAIAPVSGLLAVRGCELERPVPVISFHGTADSYIRFEGGFGPKTDSILAGLGTPQQIKQIVDSMDLPPIPQVQDYWASMDGCSGDPTESKVSTHVTLRAFTDCKQGSEVQLYEVEGGGHSWPGSAGSAGYESLLGPTTMEINANDLIWAFFEKHPLQQ